MKAGSEAGSNAQPAMDEVGMVVGTAGVGAWVAETIMVGVVEARREEARRKLAEEWREFWAEQDALAASAAEGR